MQKFTLKNIQNYIQKLHVYCLQQFYILRGLYKREKNLFVLNAT